MTKRPHALDSYLGQAFVNSLPIRDRRKTPAELAAMTIEDRLLYQMRNPLTDQEKLEVLEREDRDAAEGETGEIDPRDILDNHPPVDWGR